MKVSRLDCPDKPCNDRRVSHKRYSMNAPLLPLGEGQGEGIASEKVKLAQPPITSIGPSALAVTNCSTYGLPELSMSLAGPRQMILP